MPPALPAPLGPPGLRIAQAGLDALAKHVGPMPVGSAALAAAVGYSWRVPVPAQSGTAPHLDEAAMAAALRAVDDRISTRELVHAALIGAVLEPRLAALVVATALWGPGGAGRLPPALRSRPRTGSRLLAAAGSGTFHHPLGCRPGNG